MIEEKIQKNISLAPLSTFKIGGDSEFYVEISEKDDLEDAVCWAENNGKKVHIIGGASNLLINDKGVSGLVIKISNKSLMQKDCKIIAGAGSNLSSMVLASCNAGLKGLEWAAGIPGTVGGAVRGNAGAYGGSMREVIDKVEIYDTEKRGFIELNGDECGFKYRTSIFAQNPDLIIWQVHFLFAHGDKQELEACMRDIILKRKDRIPREPSPGSVFKNLHLDYVSENNPELAKLAEKEGKIKGDKIPAAWVIEHSGLAGKRIGGAMISEKHANFIINAGNATAEDVIMLISLIKQKVRIKFKLQLQEEIGYLGFD
jgi:UDP-N-acetylmuramate dehydrogenase